MTCERIRMYPSVDEAIRAAVKMSRWEPNSLTPYFCEEHSMFHLRRPRKKRIKTTRKGRR